MNRMRLRIAERLKQSQNAAASLTTFNEIDMSALVSLRKKYKENIQSEHGVKLGFMSFFARASVLALKEIPMANASIEGDEIVYRDYVDLSVAVATPKGLVTPVVRNTEGMSVLEIEREIAALGKKARDGKLTLEDMSGGTFTMYVFFFVSFHHFFVFCSQFFSPACLRIVSQSLAAQMEAYSDLCSARLSLTSRKPPY